MDLQKLREELDQRDLERYLEHQIEQSVPWARLNHIDFQLKQHTDVLARLSADDSRRAEIEGEVTVLSAQRARLIAEYPQLVRTEPRNAEATRMAASPVTGTDQSKAADPAPVSNAEEPQGLKKGRSEKKPARRNAKYERIDKALREISAARPKNHQEVFRFLDDRRVVIPNRKPFKAAGGWLKGFHHNRHSASAWLSQVWARLGLPAFARGPKK
jgi:hypothetical protein